MAGGGDFRLGTESAFVFEQAFENADGGVERRAGTLGRFAVPAAVGELFREKALSEAFEGAAEVGAEREHASVDAGLDFALKERVPSGAGRAEIPAAAEVVKAQVRFEARRGGGDGGRGGVDAGCAQELHGEKSGEPRGGIVAAPGPIGLLGGENRGAETFVCDARAFSRDLRRRGVCEIAQSLPTNGGIGGEEPIERIHEAMISV